MKGVPGVKVAEGQIQALGGIVIDGEFKGSTGGAPNLVLSWPSEQFDSTTFVSGPHPRRTARSSSTSSSPRDNHLKVGQKVGLATSVGVKQVTLVGVYTLGGATSLGGATIVGTTFHDAQQWYDRVGKASTVNVLAEPGVSPVALRDRIQKVVGSGVRVETGQQSADRQTSEVAGSNNGFLTTLLLAFAGSVGVRRRVHHLQHLLDHGGSAHTRVRDAAHHRGQPPPDAAGGAQRGADRGPDRVGDRDPGGHRVREAPEHPVRLGRIRPANGVDHGADPVVGAASAGGGAGIALLAATGPAFRATRVPPIAALREGAELPQSWIGRHALPIAVGVTVVGVGFIVDGIFNKGSVMHAATGFGDTASTLVSLAVGAVLCFMAVAMLSRGSSSARCRLSSAGRCEIVGLGLQWVGRGVSAIPLVGRPVRRAWYAVTRDYVLAWCCSWWPAAGSRSCCSRQASFRAR